MAGDVAPRRWVGFEERLRVGFTGCDVWWAHFHNRRSRWVLGDGAVGLRCYADPYGEDDGGCIHGAPHSTQKK